MTMPNLKETRAGILDSLLEKHREGKLVWSPREGEASFETPVGDYIFHIDRRPSRQSITYKIWIFDSSGNDLDSFETAVLEGVRPKDDEFDDYTKLSSFIYRNVKETLTLSQIAPALQVLKSI